MDTVLIDLRDKLVIRQLREEQLSKAEEEIVIFVNSYLKKHLSTSTNLSVEDKSRMRMVDVF